MVKEKGLCRYSNKLNDILSILKRHVFYVDENLYYNETTIKTNAEKGLVNEEILDIS